MEGYYKETTKFNKCYQNIEFWPQELILNPLQEESLNVTLKYLIFDI